MNYNEMMKKQIDNLHGNNKLLLHVCCAPCSSYVLERLSDIFEITILYFNPNITNEEEYLHRLNEVKRLVSSFKSKNKVSVIDGRYNPEEFFELAEGLEEEKERGKRCFKCYKHRLTETAIIASRDGFDYFATSLTLSPYKNANWINEIGEALDKEYLANYLYSDFKKDNGYKRSIELSKEFDLYRQDYCGCIYSKKERDMRNNTRD